MRIDIKGTIIPNDEKWIYETYEIESVCPRDVLEKLEKANGQPVNVHINSGGGCVFAGSEIYSVLRGYCGEVNIYIDGLAASAASVIACAAKSYIAPTAMIMVHNVQGCESGDYNSMDKMSDTLKKTNEAIAAAYVEKSGMTLEKALEMMNRETWLTAEDAVKLGLCDEIAKPQNIRLIAGTENIIPQAVIKKMQAQKSEENERRRAALTEKFSKLKTKE